MNEKRKRLTVIKIGGNVIDDPSHIASFLDIFKDIEMPKILIHGGGKLATKMATKLGIEQELIEGRRITDSETLKVITMVYAGYINKQLVASLQSSDCPAIGLSGADANLIQAHKRPVQDIDYGFVGDVDKVNTTFLQTCLHSKLVPVICPVTHDKNGQLLNTNADTIAKVIAISLSDKYEVNLIYCFEKEGVMADPEENSGCIPYLDYDLFQTMKKDQSLHSGMIPKLDMAFEALEEGVHTVRIGKWEDLRSLLKGKKGTQLISKVLTPHV